MTFSWPDFFGGNGNSQDLRHRGEAGQFESIISVGFPFDMLLLPGRAGSFGHNYLQTKFVAKI